MKKLILLSLVLLGVLVAPFAMAQSRLINYQGNILDQQDKPFQGPVQMTFELFDKEFGGTQLWSEIQNVTLNNGYFNVYLGSVVPFAEDFHFNRELWVSVTVGNGAPFKRTPLTMVPAAFASEYSDVAGFAQDIPDGSVTLIKLSDEVKTMGGDLTGELPNPRLRPGAALANLEDGSVTQEKLSPNVTTRPSGAASGDLTGFYPDPLIAEGAVKTNRIADFAVTTEKLALGSVTYDRFQDAEGPIGTILGWDGTKWIETDVPTWELGRVKNVLPGDAAYAEYVEDELGFWDITLGVADAGITTVKIADEAVTYAKLQNALNGNGTILAWDDEMGWYETTVPALEADAVIGNEVLNATPGRGLERAGLGTEEDPYTLGIANSGVITEMIADDAVTLDKLAPAVYNGQVMWWDSVTNQWQLTVGIAMDDYVMRWFDNGVTRELRWSADDSFIGNEVVGAEYGRGLITYGEGTEEDPLMLGIDDAGVVTSMLADANVTYDKLQNPAGPSGTIIAWDGIQWTEMSVPELEADGVIGNEVLDATAGRGLVRAGSGTEEDPWTLGINENGVITDMIADGNVTYNKLQNAAGTDGTILGWFGESWVETDVPTWEMGRQMAVTAGDGTYIVNTTDDNGFISTEVGIDMAGVVDYMIAEANVYYWHLQDAVGAAGTILNWDGVQWTETTVPALEADGVIGNEVLDATAGRGLVRAGSGTEEDPWTLGINENGVITDMIADGSVTYNKLQNAEGTDGTILGWFGGAWVETDVPTWEMGRQSEVTAGDGTYVINTTDDNGFISTEVGIDVAGVVTDMIADEAVTLDKLAPGTEMGQIMYFDNVANEWLLSSGLAPVEDQVVKWVDNGMGQLQAQWANDDLTLPAIKTENEETTLLTIINDGNAPAISLVGRTSTSDGYYLNNSAFEVLNDAGGRGATIIGGTANDQNAGSPYETNDAMFDDDAALIVANFEHLNGAVYPAYTTAIRAYGDIWTNGRIGGEEGILNILTVNTLNVVDLFADNAYITNLFADNADINLLNANDANIFNLVAVNTETDELQVNNNALFLGDVEINGMLDVAQDVYLNTDGGFFTTYTENLDVNTDAIVGNDFGVGNDAFIGNNLDVVNDLTVGALTDTQDLIVINDAAVGNDLTVLNDAFITGELEVTDNAFFLSDIDVTGNTTTGTLNVDTDATVGNNLAVGGTLQVTGNSTLNGNLTVSGASSLQATAVNGNLNANSRFIMSTASAANLAALVTAINNGFTVFNYQTNVPAELNLIGALPAGVTGQVIYIINNTPLGPITVGTLLNPVNVNQNQLIALIYDGTNWIPMAN